MFVSGLFCLSDFIYKTVYVATDVCFSPHHQDIRGIILVVGTQLLLYSAEIRVVTGYNIFTRTAKSPAPYIEPLVSAWVVKARAVA